MTYQEQQDAIKQKVVGTINDVASHVTNIADSASREGAAAKREISKTAADVANRATDVASDIANRATDTASAMASRASDAASDLANRARDNASDYANRATTALQNAGVDTESASKAFDSSLKALSKSVGELVRERPLGAIILTAAIGLAIGAMTSR